MSYLGDSPPKIVGMDSIPIFNDVKTIPSGMFLCTCCGFRSNWSFDDCPRCNQMSTCEDDGWEQL